MARVLFPCQSEQDWLQMRDILRQSGIILTHKQHRRGGYVCYASKKLCQQIDQFYEAIQQNHTD